MNIRKGHNYSALFAGINRAIQADFSQMELYCELGKLICARPEKGAAVAAAAYLTEECPDQAGFSARNVRRMRDFYRMYGNVPELLAQAMHLGWTQNVVILEADLTLEERAWYLQAAEQLRWSKLMLQKKIKEGTHLGAVADIDKKESICYTNGEVGNQLATSEAFGEIPGGSAAGYGADTAASSKTQPFQIGDCAMYGRLNDMFPLQKKAESVRCLGDRSKLWLGPVMTGKQRYRLCHTQIGG